MGCLDTEPTKYQLELDAKHKVGLLYYVRILLKCMKNCHNIYDCYVGLWACYKLSLEPAIWDQYVYLPNTTRMYIYYVTSAKNQTIEMHYWYVQIKIK